ncbi:hypothetical protein LTY36_09160 [Limosilactobacillus agrestis]|uniref:Uncharacterized protein n=1 Tax=Limosilactobacillus agrestis TaxID=2759748 RepID=A0A7W3YL46_9LACO|nr:hypothetical protein [Limosilactobacillus agrestis]MBB1095969.1 hypothetical protein [Limosilactobacillus agrestis]MBD5091660.1 hypothetical protein [Lactobacillus sp.]MCD7131348.1 hypothetical protein [Limosilactobacillus agrestis]
MMYHKIDFNELSKLSGGWRVTPWSVAWQTGKVAYSLVKHRRSYWAGYQASPFH